MKLKKKGKKHKRLEKLWKKEGKTNFELKGKIPTNGSVFFNVKKDDEN